MSMFWPQLYVNRLQKYLDLYIYSFIYLSLKKKTKRIAHSYTVYRK
jgi:hypothetical protein